MCVSFETITLKSTGANFLTPLRFLRCKNVVLTFNCYSRHTHYWRNFNGIHICASVFKNCVLITKGQQVLVII